MSNKSGTIALSQDLLPVINPNQFETILPKLNEILSRQQNDIGIDDIDYLQHEFELLLSICMKRHSILTEEIQLLQSKPKDFRKNLIDLIKAWSDKTTENASQVLSSSNSNPLPCHPLPHKMTKIASLGAQIAFPSSPSSLSSSSAMSCTSSATSRPSSSSAAAAAAAAAAATSSATRMSTASPLSHTSKAQSSLPSQKFKTIHSSKRKDFLSSSSTASKTVVESPNVNNELLSEFWKFVDGYCAPFQTEHFIELAKLYRQMKNSLNDQITNVEIDEFIKEYIEPDCSDTKTVNKNEAKESEHFELLKDQSEAIEIVNSLLSSKETDDLKLNELPLEKYQQLLKGRKNGEQNQTCLTVKNALCLEVGLRQILLKKGILKPSDLPDDELLHDLKQTEIEIEKVERYLLDKTHRLYHKANHEFLFDLAKTNRNKFDPEMLELYQKYFYAKQTADNDDENWINEKQKIEKRILEIIQTYMNIKKTVDELLNPNC